jgi:hypothetical protein
MGAQHRLDLGRIDVEAGSNDHFLGPAHDEEAVTLEARQISSVEPAVGVDRLCRKIRGAIVATHHIAAADVKLADLSRRLYGTVRSYDLGFDSRQQRPDGLIVPRPIDPDPESPGEHSVMP